MTSYVLLREKGMDERTLRFGLLVRPRRTLQYFVEQGPSRHPVLGRRDGYFFGGGPGPVIAAAAERYSDFRVVIGGQRVPPLLQAFFAGGGDQARKDGFHT